MLFVNNLLKRGLKTAYHYSLMCIDHYLKDADQWWSHNPVWCRFVCTICVDGSIAVLTIAEHVV